jgi:hypothetical protein
MTKKADPVEFSEEICLAVCGHTSLGLSLRKIEAIDGMPSKPAIMVWLLQGETLKAAGDVNNPKAVFVDQYARAREVQADSLADDIITIADESQYDQTVDEDGNSKLFEVGRDKSPSASDCAPLEHGAMIDGDLKIREFIYDKAVIAYFNNGNPAPVKNPADIPKVPTWPLYNTFTETITFVATLSGNITPSWKLARFSNNTGAGTLVSAQRTYTNAVVITIGPIGTQPSAIAAAALSQSAQNQHNTQVQGGATATAIQGQPGPGL